MAISISPTVVGTAATTVASVMAVNLIGVLSAHFPRHPSGRVGPSGLVPQRAISALATIATAIYVPCLTFYSLGSRLSVDVFQEAWPVLFWAPCNITLAAVLAWLTTRIALVPKPFRKEFLLACSFSNVGAVPLVMTEVLCDQQQLAHEEDCFERGTTFIFLYVFGWSLCFWTVGLVVIRSFQNADGKTRISLCESLKFMLNPPLLGCLIGTFVGLIGPLRRVIFDDGAPLLFISSAASAYGSSVVGMTTLVMAATLGKSLTSLNPLTWFGCHHPRGKATPTDHQQQQQQEDSGSGGSEANGAPPAVLVQSAASQQHQHGRAYDDTQSSSFGADSSKLMSPVSPELPDSARSSTSAGSTFVIADNTQDDTVVDIDEAIAAVRAQQHREQQQVDKQQQVQQSKGLPASAAGGTTAVGDGDGDEDEEAATKRWDVRTLVAFVVVSMFVGPAIKFGIVLLLGESVFTGANASLLQLVLSIQCVTPTANLVVVVNQREGNRRVAERLSRGVVMQYVAAIVTLLIVTAIAVSSFYGDVDTVDGGPSNATAATTTAP
ncbi:hypothetical protein PTSG_01095 [Salpingoeca rosetta]|uniref:Uncharacterized protein n=1 Tax=Salpingoeca rosetta (strain ATCC 50818 / BSB-021) TaxID=946362 RepID=F2U0T0_SALR5|nr:uncharacterized protein PTSG_01095 [Salpingoeca rosetta]EGD80504.1 hypothetical protein PTSG_01095 [Salpingoeca rosetta]|eukprot:XP_004997065.1 hypothetical protein PTSG_01095 [Salpingoeca rosetta]